MVADALHELVGDADGHVGLGYPVDIGLDGHELLEVGMFAGEGEHEGSAPPVLPDETGYHGIEIGEGDRTRGLGGGVVDPGATRCQLGEVYSAPAAVAERPGGLAGTFEDGFDGILGRLYHIAVGEGDLEPGLLEAPVGEDPPAEEELLLLNELPHRLVTLGDPVEPLLEGLAVVAVFLVPNVYPEFVVRA